MKKLDLIFKEAVKPPQTLHDDLIYINQKLGDSEKLIEKLAKQHFINISSKLEPEVFRGKILKLLEEHKAIVNRFSDLIGELKDELGIRGGKGSRISQKEYADFILEACGKEMPVVLLVENAHLADDFSLKVLAKMLDRVQQRPLLIICSYDNEAISDGHIIHSFIQ